MTFRASLHVGQQNVWGRKYYFGINNYYLYVTTILYTAFQNNYLKYDLK